MIRAIIKTSNKIFDSFRFKKGDLLKGRACGDYYIITCVNKDQYQVKEIYSSSLCVLYSDQSDRLGIFYTAKQIKKRFVKVKKDKIITWLNMVLNYKVNGNLMKLKNHDVFVVKFNSIDMEENKKIISFVPEELKCNLCKVYTYLSPGDVICNVSVR